MNVKQKLGCVIAASVLSMLVISAAATPAQAQDVTVVVNGQQVGFDQPPIERSGRVFVPLRGVFERLGATVVYDNGVINATGSGHNISLRIGSTTAIVDGSQQMLDVAPFLMGARTLVPLRFISQSLGASVDYNGNNQVVSINMSGSGAPGTSNNSVSILNMHPAADGRAQARRPAISGTFSRAVDSNSVRITLDGRDVSSTTYVSSTTFLFSPSYDLAADTHMVRVTGNDGDGNPFDRSWSFTSGNSTAQNSFSDVLPTNGTTAGQTFTVSGTTAPNSRVHITAIGTANMGGYFTVSTGSYDADVMADSSGYFTQQVTLNTVSGGDIGVRLTSIAPVTNASSTVTMHYHG